MNHWRDRLEGLLEKLAAFADEYDSEGVIAHRNRALVVTIVELPAFGDGTVVRGHVEDLYGDCHPRDLLHALVKNDNLSVADVRLARELLDELRREAVRQ